MVDFQGYQEDTAVKRIELQQIRRLWRFARPYRLDFALILGALFVAFGTDLLGPRILREAIDSAVHERNAGGRALWIGALVLGLSYLGVQVARLLVNMFNEVRMNVTGQKVIRDVRDHLFRHMVALPLSFYERNPTGRLVTRMTSDVENLNELLSSGVVVSLFNGVKIAGILVILFFVSWKMALGTLLMTPLIGFISWLFQARFRAAYRDTRTRLGRQNAYMTEAVGGVRVTRLFNREKAVAAFYGRLNRETELAWQRTVFHFALFMPLIDLSIAGTRAGLLFLGGHAILGGDLTVGTFLQFWIYFDMLAGPVQELGEKYNVLQAAMASAERIFRILDEKETIVAPAVPHALPRGPARIEFDRVRFAYDGVKEVLRGVSFRAEPGQRIAVVGATGAGKSTLINLLCRFYDVGAGAVRVDGVDVRAADPRDLRRRIGLVLQDVFLFSGDILENVRLGNPEISEPKVLASLEAARAMTFVDKLPGGVRAVVQERGATLSAGQRQLLSFARALAHDPDILILDEATASVDTETETLIQEALERLLAGRTSIVIAHRLSTIRNADRILVLHHGELREEGTHEELLARDGIYARLYRMGFE